MEARAEMRWENNSQIPIPWAQKVADRVHLRLAFLPLWDSNPQDAFKKYEFGKKNIHEGAISYFQTLYMRKCQFFYAYLCYKASSRLKKELWMIPKKNLY